MSREEENPEEDRIIGKDLRGLKIKVGFTDWTTNLSLLSCSISNEIFQNHTATNIQNILSKCDEQLQIEENANLKNRGG